MALNGTSSTREHYVINMTSGVATPLFTNWTPPNGDPQLAGAAADDANRILYFSQNPTSPTGQDVIYSWPYGDPGDPVEALINPVDVNGSAIDCSGLAFGNGKLYALNQFAAAGDGIFEIDLGTGIGTLVQPIFGLDIGGIAFNPNNGLFYGVNDGAGPGIYAFDIVAQTQTLVTPYPAGVADVDGCALDPSGSGIVYLIEDNPAPLHAFDLATMAYLPTVASPVGGTFTYSGGAWADSYFGASSIGTNYCMAAVNSTGATGTVTAVGSTAVAANDVTLEASGLPNNQFGIFITSDSTAFVPGTNGTSNGNLCLGGAIGRYSNPGEIRPTGATGSFTFVIDTSAIRRPLNNIAILPGQSWYFQAWHRDGVGLGSNFTDGLEIMFN